MNQGILGLTNLTVHHDFNTTRIEAEFMADRDYDPHHLMHEDWSGLFPGNVVVKCSHCGQWSARKTTCKYCGGAV